MSKELDKSYVFFKNLYRSGVIIPPKDKKLNIVQKLMVASVLKPKKFKDMSSTISYFEWEYVTTKFKKRLYSSFLILSPVICYYVIIKPAWERQNRKMERMELKKYGETREKETFSGWW